MNREEFHKKSHQLQRRVADVLSEEPNTGLGIYALVELLTKLCQTHNNPQVIVDKILNSMVLTQLEIDEKTRTK